jgi:hypothetical protein
MTAIAFSHPYDVPIVLYPHATIGQTCGLKVGATLYSYDPKTLTWTRQALGEDPEPFVPDPLTLLIAHVCPTPKTDSVTMFGTTFIVFKACAKIGPSNWICA